MTNEQLKALRIARGMTQTEAAQTLGISLRHYQKIEHDHTITVPMRRLIELTLGKGLDQ